MAATIETFRCMACGNEFHERVEQDEDKERSCPRCRSNSVRQLKSRKPAAPDAGSPNAGAAVAPPPGSRPGMGAAAKE